MTKENAHEYLPFVQALAEGKEIEMSNLSMQWMSITSPSFDLEPERYRIKPEKKLVPFTWDDRGLLMGKWIVDKEDNTYISMIITIDLESISLNYNSFTYEELFDNFTFLDGSPCGKEVEE